MRDFLIFISGSAVLALGTWVLLTCHDYRVKKESWNNQLKRLEADVKSLNSLIPRVTEKLLEAQTFRGKSYISYGSPHDSRPTTNSEASPQNKSEEH